MNIGHITGFSRHWYQYEFDDKGKLVERLVSHLIDPDPERIEKWMGISIRLVSEPYPNERILYYTGHTSWSNEPMFAGPLADPTKDLAVQKRDEHAMTAYMTAANVINIDRWRDQLIVSYKAWGGDPLDGLAKKRKAYVTVGTIGHVDYMGPRKEVLPPLQQAIRDVNNGR